MNLCQKYAKMKCQEAIAALKILNIIHSHLLCANQDSDTMLFK